MDDEEIEEEIIEQPPPDLGVSVSDELDIKAVFGGKE